MRIATATGSHETLAQVEHGVAVQGDVSVWADAERMVEGARERFGRLDAVACIAGIEIDHPVDQLAIEDWDAVVDTSLKGTYLVCRAAVRFCARSGGGAIVTTGSVLGRVAMPGVTAYGAAKAGMEASTRAMAIDYAREGIRANCILPGLTDTPLVWDSVPPEDARGGAHRGSVRGADGAHGRARGDRPRDRLPLLRRRVVHDGDERRGRRRRARAGIDEPLMRATRTEAEESVAVAGERGAVRTTDVTRIFHARGREITALQHVSIEARGAEFVVLLGPSGCGKSTLFQIIAGLLRPTAGEISIHGEVVTGSTGQRLVHAAARQPHALALRARQHGARARGGGRATTRGARARA